MPSKNDDLQAQQDPAQQDPALLYMAHQDPTQQLQTQLVAMPAGGLYELAQQLYPADASDPEKMKEAVHELWLLNTPVLRTEDSHIVGQTVRIPAQ